MSAAAAGRKTYRARSIKHRERRSAARIAQLDAQILAVLREDHPQSVRHVFYRMTDPRLPEPVEKSERGYRHVQHRVAELRRNGEMPYGWITDATRRGYHVNTYRSGGEFLNDVAALYRADLWQHASHYCEVWTESRSIAGVIENDCRDLAVSLYPAGGFTSLTLAYQAAEYINEVAGDKPVTIFYIGDYDPAGVLIDRDIEAKLRQHLDRDVDLSFERISINENQIQLYDLPRKPRKLTDRRAPHVEETVEAEAMPAATLRHLLRTCIEALLPAHALEVAKVAEQSERSFLRQLAARAQGGLQ